MHIYTHGSETVNSKKKNMKKRNTQIQMAVPTYNCVISLSLEICVGRLCNHFEEMTESIHTLM